MKIQLSNAGKRYNREWIFRHASLEFTSSNAYAITGPNGSGKSTLLQTIGGIIQLSEGTISYSQEPAITTEDVYRSISFCAPYLEVIEEMTLVEFLNFHNRFKQFIPGFDIKKIIASIGLEAAEGKQIRHFSSGMTQRVKLAQAIFSNTEIVLLDEPCTNLDVKGIELYHYLISTFCRQRIVIISSNDELEYSFCNEIISISNYKNTAFIQ